MTLRRAVTFHFVALAVLLIPEVLFCRVSGEGLRTQAGIGKDAPTVIKSNSLEIDNKRKTVSFLGNVEATKGDMVIHCNKMLVFYNEGAGEKASGNKGFRIDRIVASGNVRIERADGGSATAEEAVYYENEEKIVLSGKPVVKQGEDFVEGGVITLFLKEDRSVVEGVGDQKVRAVLAPRGGKR